MGAAVEAAFFAFPGLGALALVDVVTAKLTTTTKSPARCDVRKVITTMLQIGGVRCNRKRSEQRASSLVGNDVEAG